MKAKAPNVQKLDIIKIAVHMCKFFIAYHVTEHLVKLLKEF